MQVQSTTTRYCSKCQQHLPATEFGKHPYCRPCKADYMRRYFAAKQAGVPMPRAQREMAVPKPKTQRKKANTPRTPRPAKINYYTKTYGVPADEIPAFRYRLETGPCSSCGIPPIVPGSKLSVHYHEVDKDTKIVLGLLCEPCRLAKNALPILDADPERFEVIREYLLNLPGNPKTASESHS